MGSSDYPSGFAAYLGAWSEGYEEAKRRMAYCYNTLLCEDGLKGVRWGDEIVDHLQVEEVVAAILSGYEAIAEAEARLEERRYQDGDSELYEAISPRVRAWGGRAYVEDLASIFQVSEGEIASAVEGAAFVGMSDDGEAVYWQGGLNTRGDELAQRLGRLDNNEEGT